MTQHHSIYELRLFCESANFKRKEAKTEPELYTLIWKKKRGRERKGPGTTILTDARTQLEIDEEKRRIGYLEQALFICGAPCRWDTEVDCSRLYARDH